MFKVIFVCSEDSLQRALHTLNNKGTKDKLKICINKCKVLNIEEINVGCQKQ